ncbi:ca-transporting atpase [Phaffia rhodozyma]|uniref:Ca-transporting atpase n=1 Tax=Phaffia rhodozyma TaxID=264483 RepID=A0A0F7SHY8_PHARH|nr:ca-transporting atpase [Phaffia rhodozyma]
MGTLVKSGHGSGVVVATGSKTEFGVIFSMMQDVEEKRTPLQISMDELAKKLSIISFGIIGIIILIGVFQKRSWLEMFTIGVSLAVAAIPEGLPIVTTVTLALGVLRMSNRKAIVKKLPSVEALGSVSVICSDKTGTLTKNEMTVTTIYTVDETTVFDDHHPPRDVSPALRKTVQIGNLCNNSFENEFGLNVGQATDVAILNVLKVFGFEDQRSKFERMVEVPFSSDAKYMAVSGKLSSSSDAQELVYLKGSIEAVLDRCRFYYLSDSSTPSLDATVKSAILNKASEIASKGLRVVAMAYGIGSATDFESPSPGGGGELVFAGFQAMLDPPRKGVADAIAHLQLARIHVVMITGDAEQTAISIARTLGLKMQPGSASCLTGRDLDGMSERQFQEKVGGISVFARVTPKHKMMIISAFQKNGEVVAMTGDGVNDAPALKMAEIGISMGKSGTDVAKEAADVILVDDNFATILPAVEEGQLLSFCRAFSVHLMPLLP